jgi:hypothetical protein
MIYTGTLISDLVDLVERAEKAAGWQGLKAKNAQVKIAGEDYFRQERSETEQFSQTSGLSAADGNLGLLLVVHPQLVGTLEPGHNLTDAVDVHEVGSVSAPK